MGLGATEKSTTVDVMVEVTNVEEAGSGVPECVAAEDWG